MLINRIKKFLSKFLKEFIRLIKVVIEAHQSAKDWATLTHEHWLSAYLELLRLGYYRQLTMKEAIACGTLLTTKQLRLEFISWDYLSKYRVNTCTREAELFHSNKLEISRFYSENNINTVPIIAVITRKENQSIQNTTKTILLDYLAQWLQTPFKKDLLIKPIDGVSGKLVFVLEKGVWRDGKGRHVLISEIVKAISEHSPKHKISGFIVQPLLRNHPELTTIIGHERLCTMRITTIKVKNSVFIIRPIIKISAASNYIDNFSSGINQNLIASIDSESGRIGIPIGGRIIENKPFILLDTVDNLPGTWPNNPCGKIIPFWNEIKNMAIRGANLHSDVASLGWDIGLTSDGPIVLEANPAWAVDLIQAAYLKGLLPEIRRIIPETILS